MLFTIMNPMRFIVYANAGESHGPHFHSILVYCAFGNSCVLQSVRVLVGALDMRFAVALHVVHVGNHAFYSRMQH